MSSEKIATSPLPVSGQTLLILHAVWLPSADDAQKGSLLIWAERGRLSSKIDSGPGTRRVHPFVASAGELARRVPLKHALASERRLVMPQLSSAPLASHPLLRETLEQTGEAHSFGFWRIEGMMLDVAHAQEWLLSLAEESLKNQAVLLSDDLRFWQAAAHLSTEILLGEYFLPALERPLGSVRAVWRPLLDAPGIAEKIHALAEAMPPACFSSVLNPDSKIAHSNAKALLTSFLERVVDAAVRGATHGGNVVRPLSRTAADLWLAGLTAPQPIVRIAPQESDTISSALSSWTQRLQAASGGGLRACLKLSPPLEDDTTPLTRKTRSLKTKLWRLEYFLQATADPSLMVSAADIWAREPAAQKLAALSVVHPEERLLAALESAGRLFPPIEKSLKEERPDHVMLGTAEAHRFLKTAVPLLADSGFGVFLPPWWKNGKVPRLKVQLRLKPKTNTSGLVGMQSLVDFNWQLALGEEALTAKEFEELSNLKVPLVQIRGQWIEVSAENVKEATAFWNKQKGSGLSLGDVFQRAAVEMGEEAGLGVEGIIAEGWIDELLKGTSKTYRYRPVPVPLTFRGQLRPYQERGVAWLAFLAKFGFGACLADDMGLGKTIQALAYLLHEKEEQRLNRPALLICPTSVVGNWVKEAKRFAPTLRVRVHHGTSRIKAVKEFLDATKHADLVVSTYALARKDAAMFAEHRWKGIILDEAQNIKNPESMQSRAVQGLQGNFRIALTGTPVENRLSELWSIMQFLNPGYLGGPTEFHNRFAVPVETFHDTRVAETLRRLVQPFILRRLKSDPKIISDLPEKMEMKVFCTLTPEQATLYRAVVKDMMEKIEAAGGMSRRGLVLTALTKLKQVLNHPAQLLKDGSALENRSGKLERITEMLEEALSENDSALVFTQYRDMGEMLKKHFQKKLLQPTLFFHGGLSKHDRDDMLGRFQSGQERLMVLTLKAGGLGINLTRANHVFHFDRWWNPAVENQATDRAHRIGQTKKVQVHKLLCLGTLEEKIDAMIESKKSLTENVLGSGEAWLTELSNMQLRDIFELREESL